MRKHILFAGAAAALSFEANSARAALYIDGDAILSGRAREIPPLPQADDDRQAVAEAGSSELLSRFRARYLAARDTGTKDVSAGDSDATVLASAESTASYPDDSAGGCRDAASSAGCPQQKPEKTETYLPSFFQGQQVATAYDMLIRIPGFSVQNGASVRGFDGTESNVLIDGRVSPTKTQTITSILQSLPADRVQRIELLRSGAPALDHSAYSVIANVVPKVSASWYGDATAGASASSNSWSPNAAISAGRRSERSSLDLSASTYFTDSSDNTGRYQVTGLSDTVLERGRTESTSKGWGASSSTRWTWQPRPEESWGSDSTLSYDRTKSDFTTIVQDAAGAPVDVQVYSDDNKSKFGELGLSVDRTLFDGLSGGILLLQNYGVNDYRSSYADQSGSFSYGTRSRFGESIARLTAKGQAAKELALNLSGEYARNFHNGVSTFAIDGDSTDYPSSDVKVVENRVEGAVTALWRLSGRTSLNLSEAVELSRIEETGDTRRRRSFTYSKPGVTLKYTPSPRTRLELKLVNSVGQLNFSDFVTSAQVDTRQVKAGNPDLRPDRRWSLEAFGEQRFAKRGVASLTFRQEWVSDVIDYIPVGNQYDAPGNVGRAHRSLVSAGLSLPLDEISGGLLLKLGATRRFSSVTDVITGQKRRLSGEQKFTGSARLEQDLKALRSSWNFTAKYNSGSRAYRIFEIDQNKPSVSLEVNYEYHAKWGVLGLSSQWKSASRSQRRLFAGVRSSGPWAREELRRSRTIPSFGAYLRKSF